MPVHARLSYVHDPFARPFSLDDPRQSWKVTCPLLEALLIARRATRAGAEDCVQIELWANRQLDFPRRFLPFTT